MHKSLDIRKQLAEMSVPALDVIRAALVPRQSENPCKNQEILRQVLDELHARRLTK